MLMKAWNCVRITIFGVICMHFPLILSAFLSVLLTAAGWHFPGIKADMFKKKERG